MTARRTLGTALTPQQRRFIRSGNEEAEEKHPRDVPAADVIHQPQSRQTLVPLTTRIGPQTAESLRRAYLQQKLSGRLPDTQQEIVEAALRQWLRDHGFLDQSDAP